LTRGGDRTIQKRTQNKMGPGRQGFRTKKKAFLGTEEKKRSGGARVGGKGRDPREPS